MAGSSPVWSTRLHLDFVEDCAAQALKEYDIHGNAVIFLILLIKTARRNMNEVNMKPGRGSSVVEQGPEEPRVGSPILPLGTSLHLVR